MGDDDLVNQNDIEKLLAQSATGGSGAAKPAADGAEEAAVPAPEPGETADAAIDQAEIEAMLSGGAKPAGETSADADKLLAQDDIEKLLSQAGAGGQKPTAVKEPPPKAAAAGPTLAGAGTMAGEGSMAAKDVEFLLDQAQRAIASIDSPTSEKAIPGIDSFHLEQFTGAPASADIATLDLIRDVDLDVQIELGRTHMYLEDVLKLRKGSVVPLDKLAGDPVDIFVNGRLVARGEVLVLNDNFCVRVAELIAGVGA